MSQSICMLHWHRGALRGNPAPSPRVDCANGVLFRGDPCLYAVRMTKSIFMAKMPPHRRWLMRLASALASAPAGNRGCAKFDDSSNMSP